ncbi:Protein transport protein Sec24-like [Babesia sp. Xinjiang]|uniref:Protein transport protein Sec24-like n=1 Tax=Babesia sp. Xinjiang TaxID=462227 RepID=UPI000A238B3E|nr:Protein transport protein Sec24-like [Babesia sp. Xinjiang]ORM40404.1 Protein transport protein Sec24-like [Babesia sp. Xinjiang]
MTGQNDPFGGRAQHTQQSPFQNHGVQSSPFGMGVSAAGKNRSQHTGPIPPVAETQVQAPPVIAPPPMAAAHVESKHDVEGEKVLKGSLPGQVFHDNLTFTGHSTTSVVSNFTEGKTEAELMESIKPMNTPSHFIRSSVKVLPSSATLQQKTHIPLAIVVRPMAPLSDADTEIPLVNCSSDTITRCTRCRTYINPFVQFDGSRRYWTCNVCGVSNETPARYVNLPIGGMDESLPPELRTGVVEYMASADYMVRPPQAPTIMFLIDVSISSVNSGMLEVVCQTISDLIKNRQLPGGPRTMVGIMTYDTSVHFYQMTSGFSTPNILVMSDLEDLFLPLPGDLLLNVWESESELLNLLSLLPSTWKNANVAGSCVGSALRAAHFAMKHIGGKMCVFMSSPSYFGDFSLNSNALSQSKSGSANLQPVEKCKDYATMVSQTQVSIEMFVCTPQSVNLNALYHLSTLTAGNVHHIPLRTHVGTAKLGEELRRVLTRETGWEAVMRIRASKGWKITHWFGHCYIRGSDLMVLPNCHSDQTFTVTFEHEENVVTSKVAYFQAALLHTTSLGERRIRVSTYAIPVSDNAAEILLSVDPEATMVAAAQLAISTAIGGKLSDARTQLQTLCSRISNTMSSITTLQDVIAKMVVYMLGLLKSPCFSEGNIPADTRVYHWMRMMSLPIGEISAYCYPRLMCVSDLGIDYNDKGVSSLPPALNLTHSCLSQESAYLLENGECMILWVGKGVSPQWLQSVFDVTSLDALNCDLAESFMLSSKSPAAVRLSLLLRTLRSLRSRYMQLYITKQGDESEMKFFSCLIEDKTPGMMLTLNEFVNAITLRAPFNFKPSVQ